MSYSDWDVVGPNSAVLNSSLSNPLSNVFAGDYCRLIGENGNTTASSMLISASYQSGAFVSVPSTKMIRVQGCIRKASSSGTVWCGAWAKYDPASVSGYGICWFSFSGAIQLILPGLIPQNNANKSIAWNQSDPTLWLSFRMDIFPIGATGDRIVVSEESTPGSGVWTPRSIAGGVAADGIFIPSNSQNYAPWGDNRKNGIVNYYNLDGSNASIWMDKVYYAVSPAP